MVDTNYFKRPDETIDQYNARITGTTSGVNLANAKASTTLAQDQERAARQGKPGYDIFGDPIVSQPATTSSPTIASIYGTTSPQDTSFNDIGSYYQNQANKTVDEASIRKSVMDNLQREIDATNSVFAAKMLEAKRIGGGRIGQTAAINARRGLLGSDFGKANTDNQENANQDVYNSIEAERGAVLAALYSKGENTVKSELEAQTAARNQGADKYLQFLKDSEARRTNRTNSAAAAALAAGVDLTTATPEDLAKLANSYGADQNSLLAAYKAAKQKQDADALAAKTSQAELEYNKAQAASAADSKRYITLSDGANLYDTQTGQIVANNPKNFAPKAGAAGSTPGQSAPYANDLEALTGSVISTIPTKFGQEQFRAQMNKSRSDSDRINLIASQVLKAAPAEVKRDFANQAVGIQQLDKAIATLDEGVQSGFLNSKLQYAFNVFGEDYDPKLAQLNSYIVSAIQPYRNSVTGAAWGTQEDSEYQTLFGSSKFSPEELKQRLLSMKEILKSKSAEGLNVYVNPLGYYDNPFQSGNLAPVQNTQTPQAPQNDPLGIL